VKETIELATIVSLLYRKGYLTSDDVNDLRNSRAVMKALERSGFFNAEDRRKAKRRVTRVAHALVKLAAANGDTYLFLKEELGDHISDDEIRHISKHLEFKDASAVHAS